jgi:hypothetical protein
VRDVAFPQLLHPVDDLPPTTVISRVAVKDGKLHVTGITHDNGEIARVLVNGRAAEMTLRQAGLVDWEIAMEMPENGKVVAHAVDKAGNEESAGHEIRTSLAGGS